MPASRPLLSLSRNEKADRKIGSEFMLYMLASALNVLALGGVEFLRPARLAKL